MKKVRVAIIGSGPAGLTAAIYTARAELSTAVITGPQFGGQIATTHDVDNFPAFPDGITGPELTERMKDQAEKFGAEFLWDSVTAIDLSKGSPFLIKTHSEEISADAVIVTIGASPRHLNIPGEIEYTGRGVSYCATCDGAFYRNKEVIVVGGGDSALQEAIFLTKFANTVTIIHRRDELRASVALQTKAKANPKIRFIFDTVVDEVKGENGLTTGVTLRNVKTDAKTHMPVDGVFIFIGYDPNSAIFGGQLALDDQGYLSVNAADHSTSVEGVFAGGEIHDQTFRQAITASGQGCAAALMTIKWVDDREALQPLDDMQPVAQA